MPSCLDRQISTVERDAFGHRHFAQALRSIVESESNMPPYSVGLLGGWGTGKSSIKDLYIADLHNDAQKNANRQMRSDRIHTITFNAWRFGGSDQDIKRALLRHVFLELGGDEESLQDQLFRQVSKSDETQKPFLKYTRDLLVAWIAPFPALLVAIALLVGLLAAAVNLLPYAGEISTAVTVAALTGAFSYLFKQVKSPPTALFQPITRVHLPSTTAEQYEDLLLGELRRFKAGKSRTANGQSGKACERLVVFVDDLDRLSAEEMVLGLDAVRTFMEIPGTSLPAGLGIVFLISCDETRVADALARGRWKDDLPGTVFSQSDARRYLDRIFQFRLEIPPFPRHDMRRYAIQRMSELPELVRDLDAKDVTLEMIVDRMIHVGVQNPRNALQIVNAFTQSWWLAKKREHEGIGSSKAGGLHEGAITNHPICLGALSALRVDFPDFYRDLQEDPDLLHRFTDVAIRHKPITEQPLPTQLLLKERYFESGSSDEAVPVLRKEHRPLRQFLASLNGVRWPDSLQRFVLLSEDPVTRRFGAKVSLIYGALVSGDTQGVLEGLARHADDRPLKPDEARLLSQTMEDLRNESPERRTNASRVVADLVERLPTDAARLLIGSLCRELNDSLDLRSQLGLSKIANILSVAHPDDRKAIASRLVDDVLTTDGEVALRLESMERPSLSEAEDFAHRTVSLVLPVRRDQGLDPASNDQLTSWLLERSVRINGKVQQIPFEELEGWLNDHADHLLSDLGLGYVDALAAELESDAPADIDISKAVERANAVFDDLWAAGEETRPDLWNSLSRYVALKDPAAAQAAWSKILEHADAPSAPEISAFASALCERLAMHETDDDWKLDLEAGGNALVVLLRTRLSDFEVAVTEEIADLAQTWSQDEQTSHFACAVATELQRHRSESAQVLWNDWAERLLNDLPLDCLTLLAQTFPSLDKELRSKVGTKLQTLIKNDNISENVSKRYDTFADHVPDEAWEASPLKGHLDALAPQISARHANPNDYLERVYPTLTKVLHHVSPPQLGSMLQNLFQQAVGRPAIYPQLHGWMAGIWPKQSNELNPYNPQQIFQEASKFAQNRPGSSTKEFLGSLRDMLHRGIVPSEFRTQLATAGCATWKANPAEAVEALNYSAAELTAEQVASLADNANLEDENGENLLASVCSSVVCRQDHAARLAITAQILNKKPVEAAEQPDGALYMWLSVQEDNGQALVTEALLDHERDDAQKLRLWNYTVSADFFGATFCLNVIPRLLSHSRIDETASSVFNESKSIDKILGSTDDRAEFAKRIMGVFTHAATNTVKSNIAGWCKKLNGDGSIEYLNAADLEEADITILESAFGKSSRLKKLLKQAQNL